MGIMVWVTRDFSHMSEIASGLVIKKTVDILKKKKKAVLGLATETHQQGLQTLRLAAMKVFDSGRSEFQPR